VYSPGAAERIASRDQCRPLPRRWPVAIRTPLDRLEQDASRCGYSPALVRRIAARRGNHVMTAYRNVCLDESRNFSDTAQVSQPMHPIIQTYLGQFSKERSIESMDEADRFERFVNYCVISNRCPTRFEVEDVTTDDPEVGIDGVAVLIGDEVVTMSDEATALFERRHRDLDVQYLFVQAKRSETFSRDSILNLGSAVRDVLADSPRLPRDSCLSEAANIHKVVVENVNKVRNGQPDCSLFYATTGTWTGDPVLEATRNQVVQDLVATKFFHRVSVEPIGFDELRREWVATRAPAEAKFSVIAELPMPAMEGVSEAIIVLVTAQEFVERVLCDEKGNLRAMVFEQNVRHFLGERNEVNEQIRATLDNKQKKHRFAILNNGITIAAREIRRVANTVTVKDFQIVNGCQTSHVLFHARAELDENVVLVVKAISSFQEGVVDELVVATNSQTKVAESQFLAIKNEVRAVQTFFGSYPGEDGDERRLFFERRLGEFDGKGIAAVRIFDIHLLAKVFASMFLDTPHDALGSPSRVYDLPQLFSRDGIEIAYYTAAFAYYRTVLMLGNNQISRKDGIMKWHALTAMRYQTLGALPLSAPADAIRTACDEVLALIWQPPKDSIAAFEGAIELVKSIPRTSAQELRTKPFTDKLIAAALAQHRGGGRRSVKRGRERAESGKAAESRKKTPASGEAAASRKTAASGKAVESKKTASVKKASRGKKTPERRKATRPKK
jgi:hypothetical protein